MSESINILHPLELKGFLELFKPMAEGDPEFMVYLQSHENEMWIGVRLTKTHGERVYFPVHCFKKVFAIKTEGSFCVAIPLMQLCVTVDSFMAVNNSNLTIKVDALQINKYHLDLGFSAEDNTFAAHDQLEVFGETALNTSPMKFRGMYDNLDIQHNNDEWIQIKASKCNIRFALQTPGDIKEFGEALTVISPGKNVDNLTKGNLFYVITTLNPDLKPESKETPMTQVSSAVVPPPVAPVAEKPAQKRRGRPPTAKPAPETPPAAPQAPAAPVNPVSEAPKVVAPTTTAVPPAATTEAVAPPVTPVPAAPTAPTVAETKEAAEEAEKKKGRRTAAQKLADDLKDAQALLEENGYIVEKEEPAELTTLLGVNDTLRNKLALINKNVLRMAELLKVSNQMVEKAPAETTVDIAEVLSQVPQADLLAELQKRMKA